MYYRIDKNEITIETEDGFVTVKKKGCGLFNGISLPFEGDSEDDTVITYDDVVESLGDYAQSAEDNALQVLESKYPNTEFLCEWYNNRAQWESVDGEIFLVFCWIENRSVYNDAGRFDYTFFLDLTEEDIEKMD